MKVICLTPKSPAQGTAACEKVFSIPELLEKILDHVSTTPLKLFALRRLNSTFNDTLKLRKYKLAMFLERSPRLRLLDLTRVLSAKGLPDAMHPFHVASIFPQGSKLVLRLKLEARFCMERQDWDEKTEFLFGSLAYKQTASWQDVLMCPGQLRLQIEMERDITWCYQAGQEMALGQILRDAVAKVQATPGSSQSLLRMALYKGY